MLTKCPFAKIWINDLYKVEHVYNKVQQSSVIEFGVDTTINRLHHEVALTLEVGFVESNQELQDRMEYWCGKYLFQQHFLWIYLNLFCASYFHVTDFPVRLNILIMHKQYTDICHIVHMTS